MILILLCSFFLTGSVSATPRNRIIGGQNALTAEFPHQVSIQFYGNDKYNHICGGSIIGEKWVLTAAHCVDQLPSSATVLAGSNQLNSNGPRHAIQEIIEHKDFVPIILKNDIALIRVVETFTSSQIITLATTLPSVNSTCTVSGWRLTSYPSLAIPNNLQKLSTKLISLSDCDNQLNPSLVFSTNVCTINQEGEGTCTRDAGSGLIHNSIQIGVASWRVPCALGKPDVYSSVPGFRGWIQFESGI